LSKVIDSDLNNSEVNARYYFIRVKINKYLKSIRELENRMIDMKANFERRILTLIEENP
jgi:hypothetical protein